MNCKPGDLAVIVHSDTEYLGRLVNVLYVAPTEDFHLPDGYPHFGASRPAWVVELLGSEAQVRTNIRTRKARYLVAADAQLRPIRDSDSADETLTWAGKPEKVTA